MKQMCKFTRKRFKHNINAGTNVLTLVASLDRASFTTCTKATRIRKFYPACLGLIETNSKPGWDSCIFA